MFWLLTTKVNLHCRTLPYISWNSNWCMFLCSRMKPCLAKVKFNNEWFLSPLQHIYVSCRHYGKPSAYEYHFISWMYIYPQRGEISSWGHIASPSWTNPDHCESRMMWCPYLGPHYLQAPSALLHLGHSIPPLVPFPLSLDGICFRADSLVRDKWLIILGISYPCKEALRSNGKGVGWEPTPRRSDKKSPVVIRSLHIIS